MVSQFVDLSIGQLGAAFLVILSLFYDNPIFKRLIRILNLSSALDLMKKENGFHELECVSRSQSLCESNIHAC